MATKAMTVVNAAGKVGSDGRDLVNQLLGQAQALGAAGNLLRTFGVSKLEFVKKNKLYQQLAGMRTPNGSECKGTWDEFCGLLGMSVDKADEDIANLRAFGEQALDQMQRAGIGYRELRQYRRLPEDERAALIDVAQTGDKDAFLDLAEVIVSKNAGEKAVLAERIRELEATTTDLQVQRDTAEAEAAGLKKRLDRGLPDRSDQVPQVIADLRAEILALGKKASLAVDSFTPLGVELVTMAGHETGHPWADATLRLAVTQLQALEVQLHGLVHKYRTAFRDGDAAPVPTSYLTQQEMNEAAAMFDQLTQAHSFEARMREWEREQARPKGKGRPKAKPVPPGAAA